MWKDILKLRVGLRNKPKPKKPLSAGKNKPNLSQYKPTPSRRKLRSETLCPSCKGKGCEKCNYTGKDPSKKKLDFRGV